MVLSSGMAGAAEPAAPAGEERVEIKHRLVRPDKVEPGKRYPLVIYLHGAGQKGDDNSKPSNSALVKALATAEVRAAFPCFVLVPQCPAGERADGRAMNWTNWKGQKENKPPLWLEADAEPSPPLRAAMRLLDEVMKAEPIDADRVYLTGTSMGGSGSWNWAAREPGRFAAVIPVCGLSDATMGPKIKGVPVWTFHGGEDAQVPVARTRKMVEAIKAAGGDVKYTEMAGQGHGIDGKVWTREVLGWMFGRVRGKDGGAEKP
ncbi:MAG TPA: alpha/beta fold hydrolase [Tepidisphaeraceae bacterium]|nr:alpha/beta fold hydrolase [Tepidisphaeraceae bacterium]